MYLYSSVKYTNDWQFWNAELAWYIQYFQQDVYRHIHSDTKTPKQSLPLNLLHPNKFCHCILTPPSPWQALSSCPLVLTAPATKVIWVKNSLSSFYLWFGQFVLSKYDLCGRLDVKLSSNWPHTAISQEPSEKQWSQTAGSTVRK